MYSLKRQIRHAICSLKSGVQIPILIAVLAFSVFFFLLCICVIIGALRFHWFQITRIPHGMFFIVLFTLIFVLSNACLEGCVLSDCKRVHRAQRLTSLCIYLLLQLVLFAQLPLLAFCFSHFLCCFFFVLILALMALLIFSNVQIMRYAAMFQVVVLLPEIITFLIGMLGN